MTKLILICGLPGAGKTTLARELEEREQALRLTPDEWLLSIVEDPFNTTELKRLRNPIEKLIWEIATQALKVGTSVILDFGFWSRAEREDFGNRARTLGVDYEVHGLNVAREELWRRLVVRNQNLPYGTIYIDPHYIDSSWHLFEPLTKEELVQVQALESSTVLEL